MKKKQKKVDVDDDWDGKTAIRWPDFVLELKIVAIVPSTEENKR
jgi:hypothetical protein